ncbi:hypothetical protein CLV56_2051 [Mumia flava]|uniref:Helix-hairpin-helix protein n=1 Tax=Mumia flava TaxID=1348852 RepID=A0A0B2B6T9_9ACTN|nr:hypothetical protein [Mumia flava]PJJ57813.1 hypothetical protein CLV56_2051 [Mumia flava]
MTDLPDVPGAPARRALAGAGIVDLESLARWREADVAALHGVGRRAMTALREALDEAGMAFQD